MTIAIRLLLILAFCPVQAGWSPVLAQTVSIKIGTVAPAGSPWHSILLKMGQEWAKASSGKVNVKIFASGQLGDEREMLLKTRIDQIQAVALSGTGLSQLDTSVACLQIPMLIDSYAQLDFVRRHIEPKLEAAIARKGFVVLNWSDVGWIHFFTKRQARTPGDMKALKLYMSVGDPDAEALYKDLGFKLLPLAVTDLLSSLQSGLIEALDVPPLFAMLDQTFGIAKHMIDMKWAPLVGATIVSRQAWERIPESLRPELMKIARAAGDELRSKIRTMGDDAVKEMEKRGLTVVRLDAAQMATWRSEAQSAYPRIRGKLVPADLFDEVVKLSKEFRP